MIDLRNKKIGLVLSGGGAKGAYQVGMFRALEELGISKQIAAMSGCSIGAYAEAIYSISGWAAYREFLNSFEALTFEGETLSADATEAAKQAVANGEVTASQFISERRFWRYEALGMSRFIGNLVSYHAIEKTGIPMTVCAYSIEEQKPVYFKLSDLTDEEKTQAIIGSGSLQYLFKPAYIKGNHYLDGGIIPDVCSTPEPADKIPLLPMVSEAVDFILINFLIAGDSVDLTLVPPAVDYLELRPSSPLEDSPGSGTLDFSPEIMQRREELGYKDTIELIRNNCVF